MKRQGKAGRPTVYAVAKAAGFSAITVSRVLAGGQNVAPATQTRVRKAMMQLGFVPNALARGLKGGSLRTIGLLVQDVGNPFFTAVARGAEDHLAAHGYSLILCNSDDQLEKQERYVDTLLQSRVDGLIWAPCGQPVDLLHRVLQHGTPVCMVDRDLPVDALEESSFDVVVGDDAAATRALTEHALSHGYKDIAYLGELADTSTAAARQAGFLAGIATDPCAKARVLQGRFDLQSGFRMMTELLQDGPPPQAIVAGNNLIALGALRVLREARLRVPQDVALLSFGDMPVSEQAWPFLSAVVQPGQEMGQQAARLLLQRLETSNDGSLPGQKVEVTNLTKWRRSCGCGQSWDETL